MSPQEIAKVCHQANKAFCETQGDFSQADWDQAPDWQRQSSINGVKAHLDSGLTMKPEDSHISWMNEKLADGWGYGKMKDPVRKTHPCIMPYSQLPEFQRQKDYLFTAIVHALSKGD